MSQSKYSIEDVMKLQEKDNSIKSEMKTKEGDIDKERSCSSLSVEDDFSSLRDVMSDVSKIPEIKNEDKSTTNTSSCTASSPDDEKVQKRRISNLVNTENADGQISGSIIRQMVEERNLKNLPDDLKQIILVGVTQGLPNDYNVPINKRPDWLDMEKFKRGQAFARKYFCGVNIAEMTSLFILFALPDVLETLIFSENSAKPFTAFQRYVSTVVRVASWYDHDIWSEGNPGYQNMKIVKAMHLNISKRMESTPLDDLQNQITLVGSPMWNTNVKEIIQDSFKSQCPLQAVEIKQHTKRRNQFVSQMDMSITQFAFVGLMVTFPEKFGAAGASKEELDAFLHTWRGICYLLGVQDKYNFCNGTLEDVVQRCHSLIDNWIKPNFQNLSKDWEHMSRCLVEGMGYVTSTDKPLDRLTFEVSMMHLFWVLDIPAPRLYATLTWNQRFEFLMIKFIMTRAVMVPGVLPLLNWIMRRFVAESASLPAAEVKKLKNRKYDYEGIKNIEEEEESFSSKTFSRGSALLLLTLARLLV